MAAASARPALETLAAEMETVLQRHVVEAWFPRCVDSDAGGFIEDFDRQWRRGPSRGTLLEFQARQTRVAAKLALAYPEDGRFQEYALHGLRFLRDRMWDREHGGWFWRLDERGAPLGGGTKHSHGAAYAVQAVALVYQSTGEPTAREHGEEALAWYDRYARDSEFGGFHNWLTQTGDVIRTKSDVPTGGGDLDPMGHDVGLKDVNVLGDWFEALLDFCGSIESRDARELLHETAEVYLHKATTTGGEIHYAFHPDWMPQPGLEWYGYGFQAAQRFLAGAGVLPQFPGMEERARAVARHALRRARLPAGGFCFAGPSGSNSTIEGRDTRITQQSWWVQFEGMRVLALFAARETQPGPYARGLRQAWKHIRQTLLDEKYGGVYPDASGPGPAWRGALGRNRWSGRKASAWKDASHETCSLLDAIAALRAANR